MSFPYLARTTLKYKSPHATDLSFAKDETVTGPSPDDEDWLVGETLDGSKSGGFPRDFIVAIEGESGATEAPIEATEPAGAPEAGGNEPPVPASAPAPASPKLAPATLPQSTPPVTCPAAEQPPSATQPPNDPPPTMSGTEPGSPSKMTMKDRLAFFAAAQNKPSPPPPVKPKPAGTGLTWSQRQKLRQEQEEKERAEREARGESTEPAQAAAPVQAAPAPATVQAHKPTDQTSDKGAGLSAADAASSIGQGGSLKERMAALRAGGAFGAPEAEKPAPPKPSGKVWSRPTAPETEPYTEDDSQSANEADRAKSPEGEQADPLAASEINDGQEEETEEEKEKARRAAIAARMAKLGARGPMGMALPPKPARKPTREAVTSPPEEKSDSASGTAAPTEADPEIVQSTTTSTNDATPPTSVPIAAMPRRAAPPRRRAPAAAAVALTSPVGPDPAEDTQRLESTDPDGNIEPPPQVMVANEEAPLPKSDEQLAEESRHEEAGRGERGAEGAAAAGIAMSAVQPDHDKADTLEAAVNPEDSTIADRLGPSIVNENEESHEIEAGLEEGGAEKDDILKQAVAGRLDVKSPPHDKLPSRPIATVPLHPPAEDERSKGEEEEDAPPPPPHRPGFADLPKDEVELKHDNDTAEYVEEEGDDDVPPPPPRAARSGSDRPLGPRPLPSPSKDRVLPPPPIGNPLVPPRAEDAEEREAGSQGDEDEEGPMEEDVPPPPPRRQPTLPLSPNAVARTQQPVAEDENEDIPPPPPRRQSVQVPSSVTPDAPAQEDLEVEENAPAPPPPQRKPSLPAPIQTGVPMPVAAPKSPIATSPSTVKTVRSPQQALAPLPTSPRSPSREIPPAAGPVDDEEDEKTRRSGIAARMAKLGGIKFGMPPPAFKKGSTSSDGPTSPVAAKTARELPDAPQRDIAGDTAGPASPPLEPPSEEVATQGSECQLGEEDESPEAEAARRRATLARLKAGGSLGFGMFNHGPASTVDEPDQRGLEQAASEEDRTESGGPLASATELPRPPRDESDGEDAAPPPPPGRPPVPGPRPSLPPPPPEFAEVGEEADAPPPLPTSRPPRTSHEVPPSPSRSLSGKRPPVPTADRRLSGQYPTSPTRERRMSSQMPPNHDLTEEPAVMMLEQGIQEDDDLPPPPSPGRPSGGYAPPIQTQMSPAPGTHQRSASTASRISLRSRLSVDSPSSRRGPSPIQYSPSTGQPQERLEQPLPPPPTQQAQQAPPSAVPAQGGAGAGRPGYDALVAASRDSGSRLARAARAMFDQGKKAYYGDGSPSGFILVALENAHLGRPQNAWGQLVFEQEATSVMKRYDEPRAGDIAAFHDARLKGRKALQSYEQHVGSVEEPLLGVVVDFEVKNKHKIKVLQVERGVPEEVSYRLDDLKSGRVAVYRPGI